jgi:hypothetical protein
MDGRFGGWVVVCGCGRTWEQNWGTWVTKGGGKESRYSWAQGWVILVVFLAIPALINVAATKNGTAAAQVPTVY